MSNTREQEKMTDEQRVKEVWPDFTVTHCAHVWEIWESEFAEGDYSKRLGHSSKSLSLAFADAASRLPLVCGCVGECKGHSEKAPKISLTEAVILARGEVVPPKVPIRFDGQEPIDVPCPKCQARAGQKCFEDRFGVYQHTFHNARIDAAKKPASPPVEPQEHPRADCEGCNKPDCPCNAAPPVDAASRLPKAEAVASCWCDEHGTDLCPLHRTKCIECGQELPASLLGSDVARPVAEAAPQTFEEWNNGYEERGDNEPRSPRGQRMDAWNAAKAPSPTGESDGIGWCPSCDKVHEVQRPKCPTCGDWLVFATDDKPEASSPAVAGGESETLNRLKEAVDKLAELGAPLRETGELWSAWQYRVKLYQEAIALLQPPIKDVRGKE